MSNLEITNENKTLNGKAKPKNNKMKKLKQDKIFDCFNVGLLVICLIVFLYPLIYVVSASFTNPSDIIAGKMVLFPTSFSLEGYKSILTYVPLWRGFGISIVVVFFGTILNLAVTFSVGYVLSRKDFFSHKFFMFFFVFTMFFSGGLIPTYLLVAETLGMKNSLLSLIIPSAVSVWNIILAKTYFSNSLPGDLLEAAKIDGCSNIGFFFRIALPLAKPIIAVIALYNIVGRWNSYFDAMIYIDDETKWPLQNILRALINNNEASASSGGQISIDSMYRAEGMKYGAIIISTIPMLIIYPFVQKYFVKGVMVGSIKG